MIAIHLEYAQVDDLDSRLEWYEDRILKTVEDLVIPAGEPT